MDHKLPESKLVHEQVHWHELSKLCQPQIKNPSSLHQVENYRTSVKESLISIMKFDMNISHLARCLQKVIVNSATTTFGVKKLRTTTGFTPVTTWYDEECKTVRRKLQSALRKNDPGAKQYRKQYTSLVKLKEPNTTWNSPNCIAIKPRKTPQDIGRKWEVKNPCTIILSQMRIG